MDYCQEKKKAFEKMIGERECALLSSQNELGKYKEKIAEKLARIDFLMRLEHDREEIVELRHEVRTMMCEYEKLKETNEAQKCLIEEEIEVIKELIEELSIQ